LFSAIRSYLSTNSQITHIEVTGHSLGGAMAEMFMDNNQNSANISFQSITFGSPGIPGTTFDSRIFNVQNSNDPVPTDTPFLSPTGVLIQFITPNYPKASLFT